MEQTFVATHKELCELICKDPIVQSSIITNRIKWTFNPSSTLWRSFQDHGHTE